MKDEVIVVKGPKNIVEEIKRISIDELVFINIDKALFDNEEIIKVNEQENKIIIEGNHYHFLIIENSDWNVLLWIIKENGESFYPTQTGLMWLWVEGRCGYHTIYIKKEGSKAKVDEE